MLEMYRVEHGGLWLMFGLLCGAVLVQMLLGAPPRQMAGELAVLLTASSVLIVAYARKGIWDENARPSLRGNALCAVLVGAGVCALLLIRGRPAALAMGAAAGALCFAELTVMMRWMQRRQRKQSEELDDE